MGIEAISKKGFWFKIAAGPRFHAKPDDATILIIRGAPFEMASCGLAEFQTAVPQ